MIKQNKADCIRQGDLLFVPRDEKASDHWLRKEDIRKDGIVQEGEATGHHHKLADPDTATVYRPQWGEPVVQVGSKGATFVHQEHGPVDLLPDTTYDVKRAREHDYTGQIRYVVD